MQEEKEIIFRDGVIWVNPKPYLRYTKEAEEFLLEDLAKIAILKKPKPKGWIKIRNIIHYHLRWVRNKHLGLADRANVFLFYPNKRKSFENILGKL